MTENPSAGSSGAPRVRKFMDEQKMFMSFRTAAQIMLGGDFLRKASTNQFLAYTTRTLITCCWIYSPASASLASCLYHPRAALSLTLTSPLTSIAADDSVSEDYALPEPLQARFYNFYLPGSPSKSHGYLSATGTNMDTCPKCEFGALRLYTPSIDAIGLLRSGVSSLHISRDSLLNDVAHLQEELRHIEPLYIQIRDRRNKLLKDLRDYKAFLAPIRTLPPETLLQIFKLASFHNDPLHAPWILGHVCSLWQSLSRSCPSLWTRIRFSDEYYSSSVFQEKYISLSQDLPIHLFIDGEPHDKRVRAILKGLMMHSERWETLELNMEGEQIYRLLNLASSPAVQLMKFHLSLRFGTRLPKFRQEVLSNLFSSSPIQDASLPKIFYSRIPINLTELRKFHIYSSSPAELYSILQRAQHLIKFTVTPGPGSHRLTLPSTYSDMSHTAVRKLSFSISGEIQDNINNIPFPFSHITLPALRQFDILLGEIFRSRLDNLGTLDHSGMIDFLHRSQCNLTTITLDVPTAVETFLLPILAQSPGLRKLHIFVNTSVARDVFELLVSERGLVQHLKDLSIEELPISPDKSSLFEESDAFHTMILSRSGSDRRLEIVPIPVAQDSPFRDLFRIKDQGVDVKFLFNGKDCLVDENARTTFFGSF
ncbi:hypothetical protein EV421DRAFT_1739993 [Armillaria borealis]|uniref:F-box domain-containing protein n=1 Tax=Armillaria borealis TaxID=47425 RepID=A0AA39J5Q4_9AGAR|nr:hypothetical protein EV421DRAFT_1739993 [Armillaria borealis]